MQELRVFVIDNAITFKNTLVQELTKRLPDGTKIFLPEYEAGLMRILGTTELAVVLRDDRPVLVLENGKTESSDRNTLWQKLRPMMEQLPRGQQLTDILITEDPLPRTASGKIKRWELQQKVGTRT